MASCCARYVMVHQKATPPLDFVFSSPKLPPIYTLRVKTMALLFLYSLP